ncbi:DUF5994 family protein [Mycobacterium triplex]|uniref:Uncharacterized protein n=1 Tax=Mycobacterium triplex TaxID=47839 RepID=A0A024JY21_9MYCO|nr:hypothetical protein BN973_02855 [Mycobacterium triplex]
MNRADALVDVIVSQQNSTADVSVNPVSGGAADTVEARRPFNPVRLTLASGLGDNKIDGAWWPRTGVISRELPELVSVLQVRLGQVVDINVNWSSLQRQPDLNWAWWHGIHPHIMTVCGHDARAKILIVPYRTGTALAVMLLRRAAGLSVLAAHRNSRAFLTADSVLRAARGERVFELRRTRRTGVAASSRIQQD